MKMPVVLHFRAKGKRPIDLAAASADGDPLPIAGTLIDQIEKWGYELPEDQLQMLTACVAAAGPDDAGAHWEVES